jgi:hypothetical protein
LLDQNSHFVNQTGLRTQSRRNTILVGREFFEFRGEQGGFDSLTATVQQQEMGDIIGLDLFVECLPNQRFIAQSS